MIKKEHNTAGPEFLL